ncbi:hypothetical protein [Natronobacterium gregoryi]|uniref:Uncharacterized protein n=2 Tax=Natronobacterium gregoryi TaxID=44930 RepID=L0AI73_NATGS|nr:hypothetical protein [Natronobacterium gregoryi]AFZ72877.1 hypothetical protein Natgr_1678 [Natronobacterium gregoryi SP2]ELY69633.1 hypothetical protein C490_07511 [Natronobacterium gregoryi SP2]PLK21895.1 hypothetical protein CYV19_02015 [Natronobacterium gregoryi SP2]SFI66225.1 hypothetical protein SAMN05443661_10344 [Natronobacterium gregoryi]
MSLSNLAARFRRHPIATTLEVGSVVVCLLLFAATFVLLGGSPLTATAQPTSGAETPWLVIVVVGAVFVLFWTALVPLYERYLY